MPTLLAVDLGLRAGLALFGSDGRLRWYRSQHFANREALRRAVRGLLDAEPDLVRIEIEGGGPLATIWETEGRRRAIAVGTVGAEAWRSALLPARDRLDRDRAKAAADALARRVIAWSGARRPTSLRHDAAEAIGLGLWAAIALGWLDGAGWLVG